MVTSMRTSGGRTKRIRLLRREINTLRQKMNHQQQSAQSVNGNDREVEGKEEEGQQVEEEEKEQKKEKKNIDSGPLTAVSNSGTGSLSFTFITTPPPSNKQNSINNDINKKTAPHSEKVI